ncbi:ANR family transcriptional regulator [Enterobacter kobei]|uniref:ANR family transcriptional regulator n=1 Tax=Enterobacter kobei TaxID=208224 RepID=UPI003CF0B0E2
MTPHITETPPDGDSSVMQNISGRAETAAGLERQGNYAEAARWWRMAADTARTLPQRHWCESRASLCERYRQATLSQPVTP